MKVPLSWIKEFVDIDLPVEELARRLTLAGLEVVALHYVGHPLPGREGDQGAGEIARQETKVSGIAWDPEKLVVAEVLEVMPHPNADRLVLCRLNDGQQEHTVLTGAPNLYPYKDQGPLEKPLKVPYAKEGAQIYDGHQPGQVLTTLKRAKIRGVESYSMICSEKELGISDEHEGVIILDEDAPTGMPLVEYMGDVVLDIDIIANIARDANVLGVAREVAAITNRPLRQPDYHVEMDGPPIAGKAAIEIRSPQLNPRFVLGLVQGVEIKDSPYWVQRRLRLVGMRPINNIVDATNYAMFEIGEPLHAFDYDVLVERAGGAMPTGSSVPKSGTTPTIITRTAHPGEELTTLDGVERELSPSTVLVTDTAGPLSIAGVMGGSESEVSAQTRNILLEGAAWNFINIRRTATEQRLTSEAAYRFSRGVHPAMAPRGVRRGLELMRQWAGGVVAQGLVDEYPLPPVEPAVEVTPQDVERWLGIHLTPEEIAGILYRLEFATEIHGEVVRATAPDHRLDIGTGITGKADLLEEIARIYGYDRIPETRMADRLPPQVGNPEQEREERLRDLLVEVGLQEVVTYRLTSIARESRLQPDQAPQREGEYVRVLNPITADRNVLRRSLLASLLEVVERNARLRERIALFEIGPVFTACGNDLPDEPARLALAITGSRELPFWEGADTALMDFYDLKGMLETVFDGLHLGARTYEPVSAPAFHPGKSARILLGERVLGVMGELSPLVRGNYELPDTPVLGAELDLVALLAGISELYPVTAVPSFPPVLEDLAIIVDESVPAQKVEAVIRQAGGEQLAALRLFDVYRGEQIGDGKKSLAYSLTYQAPDRTLTDAEVAQLRQRIVRRLEQDLGARLRS